MFGVKELPESGYEDLRDYITTTWSFVQIESGEGDPLIRLETSDPRVYWTRKIGYPNLELNVIITGTDPDIYPLYKAGGITIGATTLHKTMDDPKIRSRVEYAGIFIDEPEDSVLLCHQVQVPGISQTSRTTNS